ncbi:TetR/AcrR family transcriptional regulator [Kribbella sp. NBC_00889]|uniref:TetR/AcrR family transcriptional regulator n=1 Tax=Kribbella sp. NBC_00889 TaxID=2975974 RepID=UPI00386BD236|nr:TetR/AcrR family transcriptional regulator [Kribbella sp. NBC_00889]
MKDADGLRARKKRETRERIAAAARELFVAHGFDAVTVVDVARAAQVSEATVFNYFPTKDDLFFGGGLEQFQATTLAAVSDRPAGESAIGAFRRFTIANVAHAADPGAVDLITTAARVVAGSPSLQAREREIVAATTDALATLLRSEGTGRMESWAIANALVGVQRSIVTEVRAEVLAGRHGPQLVARVQHGADILLARLESAFNR